MNEGRFRPVNRPQVIGQQRAFDSEWTRKCEFTGSWACLDIAGLPYFMAAVTILLGVAAFARTFMKPDASMRRGHSCSSRRRR